MSAKHPREQLTRWMDALQERFPALSHCRVRTLALWSFAAVTIQRAGSTTCAYWLSLLLERTHAAFRERLRTFYRADFEPRTLQGALFRWVLSLYRADEVTLAIDATLLGDRFAVLAASLVFRGSALPVAWAVLPANEEEAWNPHWKRMLSRLAEAARVASDERPVFVLSDRGLQSPELFRHIRSLGWHPVMRIKRGGFWQEEGTRAWRPLGEVVAARGEYYASEGVLFKESRVRCTLAACWRHGYDEPWLLMTDVSAERCEGSFYGLRSWIEQGFRCLKSGGLHVERLRMRSAKRVERLWLVLAVAALWTHAAGASAEMTGVSERVVGGVRRVLGVHKLGVLRLLALLIRGDGLALPRVLHAEARPGWWGEEAEEPSPP